MRGSGALGDNTADLTTLEQEAQSLDVTPMPRDRKFLRSIFIDFLQFYRLSENLFRKAAGRR